MPAAYLVAFLKDVGTAVPVVVNVDVYSESALSITHDWKTWPVDVLKVEGKDYLEAKDKLIGMICCCTPELEFAPLDWVIPWLHNDLGLGVSIRGALTQDHARPREQKQRERAKADKASAEADLNGLLDALGVSTLDEALAVAEKVGKAKKALQLEEAKTPTPQPVSGFFGTPCWDDDIPF